MGFFLVLKAEIIRTWIIMRRYWFATLTGLVVGYGFLMVLIIGFVSGGGPLRETIEKRVGQAGNETIEQVEEGDPFADKAVSWALGFIAGMFAFGITGMFTQGIQGMARTGQLEQVCMSPHGLVTNFLARSFVSAVTSMATSALLLWLIAASVKGQLHPDPIPTLLLLFLTYVNLIGFGFAVGGLVLVFKQIGQVASILRLALFGLAAAAGPGIREWPVLARWIAHVLPITDAAVCLKYVLVEGQMDGSVFRHESFLLLLVNCAFWTFIGINLFRFMETWSRDKGTLGAY